MRNRKFWRGVRFYFTCLTLVFTAAFSLAESKKEPVDWVDTRIGGVSHLLVPCKQTLQLPNSMMRSNPEKFDAAAIVLEGLPFFTHAHRWGSPLRFNVYCGERKDNWFIDNEKSTPYSYDVVLTDSNINVSYAVGEKAALYSLDFSKSSNLPKILEFSSKESIGDVSLKGDSLEFSYAIGRVKAYVRAEFSVLPEKIENAEKKILLTFGPENNLCMRYAVSFISFEKARMSLKEINGFDMAALRKKGREAWNKALSRVKINMADSVQKTVFYTSFWRTFERPANFDEHGEYFNFYKGAPEKSLEGKYFYTDDWSWDTYRTSHPLRALLMPDTERLCLESILCYASAHPNGWLPKFVSVNREYPAMNGNHIYASFLDAHLKGVKGLNLENLMKHAIKTVSEKTLLADTDGPAGELSKFYTERGFVPAISKPEEENCPEVASGRFRRQSVSVSTALAYDDWCIGRIAQIQGDAENADKFLARGQNYKKLFDTDSKFFLPKDSNGKFIKLSPAELRGEKGEGRNLYYTENNAYVYRFDAEHAMGELLEMFGGRKALEEALDETFSATVKTVKYVYFAGLPDHTAIVGGYSMSNEPAFRIPYLYNLAGAPWKTQRMLRHLMDTFFRDDIMGIPGDEDGGAMCAFVVFTQLGFYPVNIGFPYYEFGTPFLEDVEVSFENGHKLRILAKGASSENKYVKSIKIDGKIWPHYWISHEMLTNAKLLEFEMSPVPCMNAYDSEPAPYMLNSD